MHQRKLAGNFINTFLVALRMIKEYTTQREIKRVLAISATLVKEKQLALEKILKLSEQKEGSRDPVLFNSLLSSFRTIEDIKEKYLYLDAPQIAYDLVLSCAKVFLDIDLESY